MNWRSISIKLILFQLLIMGLLLVVCGYLVLTKLHQGERLQKEAERLEEQNSILTLLTGLRKERQRAFLSYRFNHNRSHLRFILQTENRVQLLFQMLEKGTQIEKARKLVETILENRPGLIALQRELILQISLPDIEQTNALFLRWSLRERKIEALLADVSALNLMALDRYIAEGHAERNRAGYIVGSILVLTVLLIIFFAKWSNRAIARPLQTMASTTRGIAAGNLSLRVEGTFADDEIGALAGDLNRMAQSLAISHRELEQFVFIATHDLKEPLRMVSLYMGLLENEYGNVIKGEGLDYIHRAIDGAKRMNILVEDVLCFARVGRESLPFEKVDMGRLMKEIATTVKSPRPGSEAKINVGKMPVISGVESQLFQLFQNLISNALRFNRSEFPSVEVVAKQEGRGWIFSVSDNGIGIDLKYKERIFEPFQRLHGREEFSGTGIGLAICRRVVEKHEGKIWFESTLDKGTTFYVYLPENPSSYFVVTGTS